MAATEKKPQELEKASSLAHVPRGDEYEKMISGMLYNAMDPDLASSRFEARRTCHAYNSYFPSDPSATFATLAAYRLSQLRSFIGAVGDDTFIEPPFRVDYGCNIRFGSRFYANFGLIILDCALVTIGDRVMFGPNVSLLSATHETDVRNYSPISLTYRRPTAMATQTETELVELALPPSPAVHNTKNTPDLPNNNPQTDQNDPPKRDRATLLKLLSASFSFFVAGVNDGSIGALIPYFMRQYGISMTVVSSVFAANFLGWLTTALTNTHLSQHLPLGSLLTLGAAAQFLGHALRAWGPPPLGLLLFSFWLITVGQAFQDTHANTFVAAGAGGSWGGTHRWLGFVHAMYMAGCLVGPFVATAVASAGMEGESRWYFFYLFPLGLGLGNLGWVVGAFWDSVGIVRKKRTGNGDGTTGGEEGGLGGEAESRNDTAAGLIKTTLTTPSVWLLSLFFFFFLGAAITVGGWLVEFLVVVRGGELADMGYVPAGFNGGCLLGRLLLAEPTKRLGERRMVLVYAVLCVGLQLLFWLVPNIIAASVAVSFLGFFSGPFFATGISVGSKLFPPHIHSTALALVFVIGQIGGSAFPIVTGVLATRVGVSVLQPILVGLYVATAVSWLLIPRPKTTNAALHEE
ncbi:major facilitator superfamily domain-containing protein [Chaetomium sp. MPI-SDFR-AT-0129]|nr:major facilitator superfamily domain-containing protein [Chaetomium sp. MPI-SDFR-AT-0129]